MCVGDMSTCITNSDLRVVEAEVEFFELALTFSDLQLKVGGYMIVEACCNLCFDEVINLVRKFPFNYSEG